MSNPPLPPTSRRWRPALEAVALPVGAVLVALLLFGVFCAVQGANPLSVFKSIQRASFGSWYSFQNTLIRAAPLILTALCTALPARLGLIVIGNEGALVVGGLAATAAGLAAASAPPFVALTIMVLAGMAGGGAWIGLVGLLHYQRGVNETISGLLLNYVAIAVLSHLVNGPMRDPASLNKPSSYSFAETHQLGGIAGSNVHYGLVFGVVFAVFAWVLMEHTSFGFKARMIGGNIRAARMAGLPVARLGITTCLLGGAAAGLAGMVEVAAIHGRANESLAAGYGYAGILVAFVARFRGLPIILVAVLLGGILASGGILQRQFKLPDATILVFQGIVFLCILFSDSLYGRFACFKEKTA
ncbi:MAG: ABC transporter permease [Opitutus sp.]|nr:ABC transporter permease [Opitutus sp.]MCS6247365.1 ABC transporter permease [Opitutus sp.]MCS6274689.1 ABC transporter permease [Opitutus sp.]MCS6276608.1 ABC transporter permease [Opitutus sp.]MCS6301743.1 ABC transporter permease [Opitutus sp.]